MHTCLSTGNIFWLDKQQDLSVGHIQEYGTKNNTKPSIDTGIQRMSNNSREN
jgi:hypothetical protein